MNYRSLRLALILACLLPVTSARLHAGEADQNKRSLTHDDYASWKRIQAPQISADGAWALYKEMPNHGDGELVVIRVADGKEFRHAVGFNEKNPRGTDGTAFTRDTRQVIFLIYPSQEEVEAAEKDKKKKASQSLGILDLNSGDIQVIEKVKEFKLPAESGGWVAYLHEPEKEENGKDESGKASEKETGSQEEGAKEDRHKKITAGEVLVLRSLGDGSESEFPGVRDYFFTDDARDLFFTSGHKEDPGKDGVYRVQPGEGKAIALLQGEGNYTKLAISKDQSRLAFLSDQATYQSAAPLYELYGFERGDSQAKLWVSQRSTSRFPSDLAISDKSDVELTESGDTVSFGLRSREAELQEALPEEKKDEPKTAQFDLWHWNDPYPQPQQKVLANRYRNRTFSAVFHIDEGKFVQLADAEVPDVDLSRNGHIAYASNGEPYTKEISYDGRFADLYVIDPENGQRRRIAEKVRDNAQVSPEGKYLYWFGGKDWFAWDVEGSRLLNLTDSLPVELTRYDWDTPTPARDYGSAGWTKGDRSFLIYDRYDIWELFPGGRAPRMITEGKGRQTEVTYRYSDLDPDERAIDPAAAMLLSTLHEDSMQAGFAWDQVDGNQQPADLLRNDVDYGNPIKAKDADVFLFSRSSFDTYPDLWLAGPKLSNPRKLTNLGSQMEPFVWGHAELRDFYSSDGVPLKGILIKPDNFDPSRKYPLMVYIYETLHNGFHRFTHPSPGSSINTSYYVSNGYIVWMPDIEYGTGYPGKDALKCVLPGIQMLVREGYIDEGAIGIQGHSWGGYQIAYMITQTNIFKAAESGAPVSNMVSAYDGIRWQSGMVRQFQYEHTQSRLGASLWEVPMRYIENSPIFWADKIQTPVLILHNDADGAVPWYQGIEFIMALRRLEKEAYMFSYYGEAHGLRKWVNQLHYTKRMAEFFDHELKGAPEPEWMKEGILAWKKPAPAGKQ